MNRIQEFNAAMDDLVLPYERELMTVWEQGFYEDMLEAQAAEGYRFTDPQIDQVLKMREKYDLDIKHGEALR